MADGRSANPSDATPKPRVIPIAPKKGAAFDATSLRKAWHKPRVVAGLRTLTEVEGKADPRYTGFIIHDPRRSANKDLMKAGVNEKVAMKLSGHKTRAVFGRYHIVDTEDMGDAKRLVQGNAPGRLVFDGENK